MPFGGVCFIGAFARFEQVNYGAAHAQAGQPVPNMYRLVVEQISASGERFARNFTYNRLDRDTEMPTPIAQQLEDYAFRPGQLVVVGLRGRSKEGSKYVDYDAMRIAPLPSASTGPAEWPTPEPAVAAVGNGNRPLRASK